jgi:hypothetical protein
VHLSKLGSQKNEPVVERLASSAASAVNANYQSQIKYAKRKTFLSETTWKSLPQGTTQFRSSSRPRVGIQRLGMNVPPIRLPETPETGAGKEFGQHLTTTTPLPYHFKNHNEGFKHNLN